MKIGLLLICTGELYWQYAKPLVDTARAHFLQGKDVDYLLWTDMPNAEALGCTVIEAEHTPWPYPTLMRYHLFLQQEELLQKYDYLFYCDVDMLFVNTVGEEILGPDLTATIFPMFNTKKGFEYAPFDPNPASTAFVDSKEFWETHEPKFYFAGGFQGGTKEAYLGAMHSITQNINKDFAINYTARWNDESHWNRYCYDHPPSTILSPSYTYPDSMITDYYEKIWGCSYTPRLVTLTKKFTLSKEGGAHAAQMMNALRNT